MKRRISAALARAGAMLIVAGSLGFSAEAVAQSFSYLPAGARSQAPAASEGSTSTKHADSTGQAAATEKATPPTTYHPTRWRRMGTDQTSPPKETSSATAPATPPPATVSSSKPAAASVQANMAAPKKVWLRIGKPPTPSAPVVIAESQAQSPTAATSKISRGMNGMVALGPAVRATTIGTPAVKQVESSTTVKTASYVMPPPGQKNPTTPSVSSGVVLMDRPTAAAPAPPKPAPSVLQTSLKNRIALACGKAAQDVQITAMSETRVAIRVKAHNEREGEELAAKILTLPELRPYQVSLDVPIVP
jgi:hypothetical protein